MAFVPNGIWVQEEELGCLPMSLSLSRLNFFLILVKLSNNTIDAFLGYKIITMYWKDELDALYQKNAYGKRLSKQLVGNQVELLLRNNLGQVGTVLEIAETQEGIQLHFKASGNSENSTWVLSHKDIKYIDPFLK